MIFYYYSLFHSTQNIWYVDFALTDTHLRDVKKVDKVPVPADGVVRHIVGTLKDVAHWASEVNIVKLKL